MLVDLPSAPFRDPAAERAALRGIADPQRVARAVPAAARTGADHRRRDHEDRAAARFVRRAVR